MLPKIVDLCNSFLIMGIYEREYMRLCAVIEQFGYQPLINWIRSKPNATDNFFYISAGQEFEL